MKKIIEIDVPANGSPRRSSGPETISVAGKYQIFIPAASSLQFIAIDYKDEKLKPYDLNFLPIYEGALWKMKKIWSGSIGIYTGPCI